jgi:hypothetical protein
VSPSSISTSMQASIHSSRQLLFRRVRTRSIRWRISTRWRCYRDQPSRPLTLRFCLADACYSHSCSCFSTCPLPMDSEVVHPHVRKMFRPAQCYPQTTFLTGPAERYDSCHLPLDALFFLFYHTPVRPLLTAHSYVRLQVNPWIHCFRVPSLRCWRRRRCRSCRGDSIPSSSSGSGGSKTRLKQRTNSRG